MAFATERLADLDLHRLGDGVQSGVQIERNRDQLSATHNRSSPPKSTRYAWIAPAGGRAVAGSNPVSPIAEKPC